MFLTNEDSVAIVGSSGWQLLAYQFGIYKLLLPAQVTYVGGTPKQRGGSHFIGPVIGKPVEGGPFVGLPQHGPWRSDFMMTGLVGEQTLVGCLGGSSKSPFYSAYPYEYELRLSTKVLPTGFSQGFVFQNFAEISIPVQFGFHPYFWVRGAEVEIKGSNNGSLSIVPPFPTAEVYGHAEQVVLSWPYGGKKVTAILTAGGILQGPHSGWVVWSDNRKYLCVEPFSHIDRTEYLMVGPGKMATGAFQVRFCVE